MTEASDTGQAATGGDTLLPQPRGGARTWYEVLDVGEDASAADVQKAYERALALVEGRSIGGYLMLDPMAAESARADVEAAYAILGNAERRAAYDRERGKTVVEGADAHASTGAAAEHAASAPSSHDEEAAEARALLGDGDDASLPRRTTPLKFLSPIGESGPTPPAPIKFEPPSTDPEPAPVRESEPPTQATMPPSATMPAPAPAPQAPSTVGGVVALPDGPISGALIKELRVARGLGLDEVADATKIRKPYLRAIEDEDLSGLPARVYLRGFLTQVARVLKVDRARLAEGYLQFVEQKGGAPKE